MTPDENSRGEPMESKIRPHLGVGTGRESDYAVAERLTAAGFRNIRDVFVESGDS